MSHSVATTPSTLPRYVAGWTRAARREQGRVHTSWRSTPTWMRSSGGTTGGRVPSSKRAATRRRPRSPTGRPTRACNPWCARPGGSRVAGGCASCSSRATWLAVAAAWLVVLLVARRCSRARGRSLGSHCVRVLLSVALANHWGLYLARVNTVRSAELAAIFRVSAIGCGLGWFSPRGVRRRAVVDLRRVRRGAHVPVPRRQTQRLRRLDQVPTTRRRRTAGESCSSDATKRRSSWSSWSRTSRSSATAIVGFVGPRFETNLVEFPVNWVADYPGTRRRRRIARRQRGDRRGERARGPGAARRAVRPGRSGRARAGVDRSAGSRPPPAARVDGRVRAGAVPRTAQQHVVGTSRQAGDGPRRSRASRCSDRVAGAGDRGRRPSSSTTVDRCFFRQERIGQGRADRSGS